jgi:adenosylmethionine-8-amino-7-oxononanoate aminotransferase
MMGAIEVGEPGYEGEIGWRVFEAARRRGVYLRPLGNTVYVVPPLNISDADLNRLLSVVGDSIREALSAPTG